MTISTATDSNYTMVGKLSKSVLGTAMAYNGLHDRLRAVGAEYLRSQQG